jgi:hypothetical protein
MLYCPFFYINSRIERGSSMYNFGKKKNQKLMAAIVIIVVAAMLITTVLAAFM